MYVVRGPDDALGNLGEHDGPRLRIRIVVLENRGRELLGMGVVIAPHTPQIAPWQRQRRLQTDRIQRNGLIAQGRQRLALGHGLDQRQCPTERGTGVQAEGCDLGSIVRNLSDETLSVVDECRNAQASLLC